MANRLAEAFGLNWRRGNSKLPENPSLSNAARSQSNDSGLVADMDAVSINETSNNIASVHTITEHGDTPSEEGECSFDEDDHDEDLEDRTEYEDDEEDEESCNLGRSISCSADQSCEQPNGQSSCDLVTCHCKDQSESSCDNCQPAVHGQPIIHADTNTNSYESDSGHSETSLQTGLDDLGHHSHHCHHFTLESQQSECHKQCSFTDQSHCQFELADSRTSEDAVNPDCTSSPLPNSTPHAKLDPRKLDLSLNIVPVNIGSDDQDSSSQSESESNGKDVLTVTASAAKPPSGRRMRTHKKGYSAKQSWLLRLFESKLFDMSIAITYLFNSKEPGVQTYIGKSFRF